MPAAIIEDRDGSPGRSLAGRHDGLMRPVALFWPYNNAQRRHLLRIVDE
jgi:hypothetical protein